MEGVVELATVQGRVLAAVVVVVTVAELATVVDMEVDTSLKNSSASSARLFVKKYFISSVNMY